MTRLEFLTECAERSVARAEFAKTPQGWREAMESAAHYKRRIAELSDDEAAEAMPEGAEKRLPLDVRAYS